MDRGVIVARARRRLGVAFRLHGRGAEGLDCVGLVAAALGIGAVPGGYRLRGGGEAAMAALDAQLLRVTAMAAGDVLLMATGPGQVHLGIWTGDALIHADRGLGRVVERPGAVPWPILGIWRRGA